jgi:hypothetical protein
VRVLWLARRNWSVSKISCVRPGLRLGMPKRAIALDRPVLIAVSLLLVDAAFHGTAALRVDRIGVLAAAIQGFHAATHRSHFGTG